MEQPSVEAEKEIFQEALIEDMFAMAPANMKGYELGNTAGEACMIQPLREGREEAHEAGPEEDCNEAAR